MYLFSVCTFTALYHAMFVFRTAIINKLLFWQNLQSRKKINVITILNGIVLKHCFHHRSTII